MPDQGKRGLLGLMAAGAALSVIKPASALASLPDGRKAVGHKALSLHNLHTGERLKAVFWEKGRYITDAVSAFNKILRDHRTGEVHTMDPELYHLLATLQTKVEYNGTVDIISGYRSSKSNEMLRSNSGGVAKKSFHLQGKAIDIAMPGKDLKHVYKAALTMRRGGVGLYTGSGFVHVDTGPVRTWGA